MKNVKPLRTYWSRILIQQGFLQRTPRGRMATVRAWDRLAPRRARCRESPWSSPRIPDICSSEAHFRDG
ncbi:Holliday junction DNA helicase RuvB C-terminal domain-containing protein [Shigella flexneri]